ncbi:MAG TPA: SpoIID/LytB domain-containing protein [Firmicutes bacterium]|nr:SpoIID/LytB domain-containing protein [Bacillota bacterium]
MKKAVLEWFTALLLVTTVCQAGCSLLRRESQKPPTPEKTAGTEPTITLHLDAKGETRQLKLEDYVQGVVAAEMEPSWPLEALKSQAIVARTFTLQKIEEGRAKELHGTDACDNKDHFQAYDASRISDAVKRAVQETRGLVLTYNGKPIRAFFHSNSGGKTATAEEGLNFTKEPTPYLAVVDDPFSLKTAPAKEKSWSASFTSSEVKSALSKLGKSLSGVVNSFQIGKRGPSGRAMTFSINGIEVPAADLRLSIGPDRLKSTFVDTVNMAGGKVTITGKGWGHGVGLSQWGAMAMASEGKKCDEIIKYYYPKATLTKMWQ